MVRLRFVVLSRLVSWSGYDFVIHDSLSGDCPKLTSCVPRPRKRKAKLMTDSKVKITRHLSPNRFLRRASRLSMLDSDENHSQMNVIRSGFIWLSLHHLFSALCLALLRPSFQIYSTSRIHITPSDAVTHDGLLLQPTSSGLQGFHTIKVCSAQLQCRGQPSLVSRAFQVMRSVQVLSPIRRL